MSDESFANDSIFFWQFLVSQWRLRMKYWIVILRRNEQGDMVIKSLKWARRRIRALRSNARNKRPKQAKRIRNARSKELKSCLEKERRYGREKRAEGAYEELWRLAKSLGFAPGENYSRYEFTVGAGSQGKRTVKGEQEWEGTTDSGRAPGQIRLERIAVGLNMVNLETRAANLSSPSKISSPSHPSPHKSVLHACTSTA